LKRLHADDTFTRTISAGAIDFAQQQMAYFEHVGQVTWKDFQQFAQLRQSVHKLAVALDFFYSTEGNIGRADFQRAVVKILGRPLAEGVVSAMHSAHASSFTFNDDWITSYTYILIPLVFIQKLT